MEHSVQTPRNYVENEKGQVLSQLESKPSHKFWKEALLTVEKGTRAGTIVGRYISAKCEIGDGPNQLRPEDLEAILAGKDIEIDDNGRSRKRAEKDGSGSFRIFTDAGGVRREDVTVVLGGDDKSFTRAEIEEMLTTVKPKTEKRGPGRPKKDDGETDS